MGWLGESDTIRGRLLDNLYFRMDIGDTFSLLFRGDKEPNRETLTEPETGRRVHEDSERICDTERKERELNRKKSREKMREGKKMTGSRREGRSTRSHRTRRKKKKEEETRDVAVGGKEKMKGKKGRDSLWGMIEKKREETKKSPRFGEKKNTFEPSQGPFFGRRYRGWIGGLAGKRRDYED